MRATVRGCVEAIEIRPFTIVAMDVDRRRLETPRVDAHFWHTDESTRLSSRRIAAGGVPSRGIEARTEPSRAVLS